MIMKVSKEVDAERLSHILEKIYRDIEQQVQNSDTVRIRKENFKIVVKSNIKSDNLD